MFPQKGVLSGGYGGTSPGTRKRSSSASKPHSAEFSPAQLVGAEAKKAAECDASQKRGQSLIALASASVRSALPGSASGSDTSSPKKSSLFSRSARSSPQAPSKADAPVEAVDSDIDADGGSESLGEMIAGIFADLDKARDATSIRIVGGRGEDDLNSYSIFAKVSVPRKLRLVCLAKKDVSLSRAMGSMCGMGVGDALGHPFEFMPIQDSPAGGGAHFDLRTFKFHGESNAFRLERGQWTDDAAMGLCMADSFIFRRKFDGGDMRTRFWCWWNRGYNNAFRKDPKRSASVGLGGNIAKSLSNLSRLRSGQEVPPAYNADGEDAGNGSLMRFTPVAVFMHSADWQTIHDTARASSYTTHPGIIAAEACAFLAHLLVSALRLPEGQPGNVQEWLDKTSVEYMETSRLAEKSGWGYDQMKWLVSSKPVHPTERCWNWKHERLDVEATLRARGSRYNGYPVTAGYFGAYSLDGLAMALWSVYHTTSFDEAVTRSVNLLGDADSHGSITGQLAGALYGIDAIHPQFLAWLHKWDEHEFATRAVLLHKLGAEAALRTKGAVI